MSEMGLVCGFLMMADEMLRRGSSTWWRYYNVLEMGR